MSHEFTRLDLYQPIGSEPLRAMLRYFACIVTHREEVPSRKRDCELLLVQGRPLDEIAPPGPWQKIWE
ncbi:MAG: hypothetical protein HYU76_03005, partial [Betaproteobacteria bacterium]|nr:hypothetical protein [Betaproteobacteria bacterium]